jgi:heat-inducible transcriptional repressor
MRPAHEGAVSDRVEFSPLGGARVLVVIVALGGHVIQKVIDVAERLSADELRQSANYLNAEFSGLPLQRAREAVLERLAQERTLYDELVTRTMRLATSTFADLPGARTIYVDGAASLLEETHGLTLSTLQTLVQLIEKAAAGEPAQRASTAPA